MRAQPLQAFAQLLVGGGEGHSHILIATRPKVMPGTHRGIAGDKEIFRKFKRALPRRANVNESIECALRRHRKQRGIAEDIHDNVARRLKISLKLGDRLLVAAQRRFAGLLRDR